jgi:hypothetical protein
MVQRLTLPETKTDVSLEKISTTQMLNAKLLQKQELTFHLKSTLTLSTWYLHSY